MQRPLLSDSSPQALLGPDPFAGGAAVRSHIRMITVSTLVGSATFQGTSHSLGGKEDTDLLLSLRDWAEVVVVGSKTVKKEDYGPVQGSRGEKPAHLCILSYSLDLDTTSALFTQAVSQPFIATPEAVLKDADKQQSLDRLREAGADIINTGDGSMRELIDALAKRGLHRIVCEGGPGIYSKFIAEDLVDQLYLTLDPHIAASVETPLVHWTGNKAQESEENFPPGAALEFEHLGLTESSSVFLRYGRRTEP